MNFTIIYISFLRMILYQSISAISPYAPVAVPPLVLQRRNNPSLTDTIAGHTGSHYAAGHRTISCRNVFPT